MNKNEQDSNKSTVLSGRRRGRPQNLKPWQRGQSGNPGGRPKSAPLSRACRDLLARPMADDPEGRTYAEVIAETLAEKALAGDIRAAQEIADRAEGRPRQSIEVGSLAYREAFERMTDEELEAYARDGKLPEWFNKGEVADETT